MNLPANLSRNLSRSLLKLSKNSKKKNNKEALKIRTRSVSESEKNKTQASSNYIASHRDYNSNNTNHMYNLDQVIERSEKAKDYIREMLKQRSSKMATSNDKSKSLISNTPS